MRLTAFTRYGRMAASTRQRLLQYLPHLEAAGVHVEWHALLSDDYVGNLADNRGFSRTAVGAAYLRRMRQLASSDLGDAIWIYAELFPFLPGWFEKLAFWSGKPVIYDFDDAFFHTYDSHPHGAVRRLLGAKLEPLLKGASAACCGNAYLQDYAARFCERTIALPTVVDIDFYRPRPQRTEGEAIVIGWIGSPSTWQYVRPLLPLLAELTRSGTVRFRAVGAGKAAEADRFEGLDLVDWTEANEVRDVQSFDIGIMPVPDEAWARGKSGYKLIQYMACGLPVVASPVGVNSEIVEHGGTGYLARSEADWGSYLRLLLDSASVRTAAGQLGRERAVKLYSLQAMAPRLVHLIKGCEPSHHVEPAGV